MFIVISVFLSMSLACVMFHVITGICSSNRSISFGESMPPPRELVTHGPINWQSALIPSSSQELFF